MVTMGRWHRLERALGGALVGTGGGNLGVELSAPAGGSWLFTITDEGAVMVTFEDGVNQREWVPVSDPADGAVVRHAQRLAMSAEVI